TLTRNDSARFECRWVTLNPQPASPCIWTAGLDEPIYCPVAHGEGKFVARDAATLAEIERAGLVALRYGRQAEAAEAATTDGTEYPWNPNGSQNDIAGVCNPAGTILGLMPHPEDHILSQQHPRVHRGEEGMLGLPLFVNGVRYAAQI
ncbi:MAG: phosphoribosylformylglycinamidine synthase subunit PurQ, partial [Anaerolineae bacterium]|nr:phosphoribosylformylglycinamidine synthase subunit PurQ [Anaerolineae bacterium]